ncbi:MAG: hypothetical protein CME62_18100 [Halobacteriovoraceae bacterium]|nr:hypothetical protein [Halobacteriovoraceae bacterium]|tara:strand:+ start:1741 stop:3558 length:1818 start_codon:yes stop_codon:yes gene_type:complete
MTVVKKQKHKLIDDYRKFKQIDGSHPFKKILPNGFIDYPARIRRGGKVSYFNFELAKKMGLISKNADHTLTKELTEEIYNTFSIQIINEFDQMKGRKFKAEDMKEGTYMATRYLQMQHDDKKGLNSGDGRSVWLGHLKHQGQAWDISACGTGATRLSPATSKYNKFFETGDPSIAYGCGYGELDEGIATAIMSEIFHNNNIKTEQTLCIIEFKNNISINIRVHENLLRPSHFFLYLKQDDYKSLKNITDFYIQRQVEAQLWDTKLTGKKKYNYFLDKLTETFAQISADFEDQYIFCWLDWDGDNILMDGGIIDYGSIRQFGLFHHEYRYDDDDRFSTNILEQKSKAKYMLQTFVQAIDFIKTKEKKQLNHFANDKYLENFEVRFEQRKNENLLKKMGFSSKKSAQYLKRYAEDITQFRKTFNYFEKAKVKTGMVRVPDGKTCDAVFNMRSFLREYPQVILAERIKLSDEDLIEMIQSVFAEAEDIEINNYRRQKLNDLQDQYIEIVEKMSSLFQEDFDETLMKLIKRSHVVNKPNRITGDAVTYIVELIKEHSGRMSPEEIYNLIQDLVVNQNTNPDIKLSSKVIKPNAVLQKMFNVIRMHREGL